MIIGVVKAKNVKISIFHSFSYLFVSPNDSGKIETSCYYSKSVCIIKLFILLLHHQNDGGVAQMVRA